METQKLIDAINDFMSKTSKVDCEFTTDDMIKLENVIKILEKHIEIIYDYELKHNKGGE